jgi:hypothetical protein
MLLGETSNAAREQGLPMIEHLSDFPGNVVAFACRGRVTTRDYETV